MSATLTNLRLSAILGLGVVLPFVLLELAFSNATAQSLPALNVLFGLMWLMSAGFIFLVLPIVQNVRTGNSVVAKPLNLLLRITSSAVIFTIWASLVIDQLPCFLGVPNCD